MCIRDSLGAVDGPGGRQTVEQPGAHHPRVGDRLKGREGLAVSYTHLRAHETVLDLVCRLLLEKKKNNNTHKKKKKNKKTQTKQKKDTHTSPRDTINSIYSDTPAIHNTSVRLH